MNIHQRYLQLILAVALGGLLILIPGLVLAADLLSNGSFDSFQSYENQDWRGFPEKIGQNWTARVLAEDGLHFMDSHTFGQFLAAVYGQPYSNYRIEGDYSQVCASRRGFNFVFSQTVTVEDGRDYAFGGKIVTFWKGPGGETDDTKIFKRIGLDPTGGTDYDSPNVVWTDWDSTDNAWTSPALAATAEAGQMTAFIQVDNRGGDVGATALNSGHIDSFKLELAPVGSLNLPTEADPGDLLVSWGATIPDSSFWNVWGYDVQFKDDVTNIWQTVQSHDGVSGENTSYTLAVQNGRIYTVRVRPWQQRAPAGDSATTALPGVWVEKSVVVGQQTGSLTNGSFELFTSYGGQSWLGYPEKYGLGWTLQVVAEDDLHLTDSDTFGSFASDILGVSEANYKRDGDYSQAFASDRPYEFLLSQSVAISTGQSYAFGGQLLTFWKDFEGDIDHTRILKRIGLDPTGGVDYTDPAVLWTAWDGTDKAWLNPALTATAQADQMTVFIQVENSGTHTSSTDLSSGFLDSFRLEEVPTGTLNLPAHAIPTVMDVTWQATLYDPAAWSLAGYDAQYHTGGAWQTIQTYDGPGGQNTGYRFEPAANQSYTFRMRPWQVATEGGTVLPGLWVEKSMVADRTEAIVGRVTDHTGYPLSGVTVAVSGTLTTTLSDDEGRYVLPTDALGVFVVAAADWDDLAAPPATPVEVISGAVSSLDITLRPTGESQAIANGDFETDLTGWSADSSFSAISGLDYHSGQSSLILTGPVTISQTQIVTGLAEPVLSFWHKNDAAFTVSLAGEYQVAATASPSETVPVAAEWTQAVLEYEGDYSGQIGVRFSYAGSPGAQIFIDEVSLASGSERLYLPLIVTPAQN